MNVIWNLTRVCPWNCPICCVSAVYIAQNNKKSISLANKQLENELSFDEKMKVLNILAQHQFDIDFSGGDPLFYEDDYLVVKRAIELLPKEKLNVSMTSKGVINRDRIETLKKVDAVELTLDVLAPHPNSHRPKGFDSISMEAIKTLNEAGVKVRAVTVLHSEAITQTRLQEVYDWLCENGIPEWSVLKPFRVGRGLNFHKHFPDDDACIEALKFLRKMNGYTKIAPQHVLDVLCGTRKCHAAMESIGILPDGTVTACAWALDTNCRPFPNFHLGRLPDDNLTELLERARNELGYANRSTSCRILNWLKEKGTTYEN